MLAVWKSVIGGDRLVGLHRENGRRQGLRAGTRSTLLIAAEQKTNPRLMETLGALDLVPPARRVVGPGALGAGLTSSRQFRDRIF